MRSSSRPAARRCASPARSFADRARGLTALSSSLAATIGLPTGCEGCGARRELGQMARAGGLAGAVREEALDDAVFQRMEGDDDEPAARLQRPLGGKQRLRPVRRARR